MAVAASEQGLVPGRRPAGTVAVVSSGFYFRTSEGRLAFWGREASSYAPPGEWRLAVVPEGREDAVLAAAERSLW